MLAAMATPPVTITTPHATTDTGFTVSDNTNSSRSPMVMNPLRIPEEALQLDKKTTITTTCSHDNISLKQLSFLH